MNEGGRAAMEMIVRELSQMEVSGFPPMMDAHSGRVWSGSKSFHSRPTPGTSPLLLAYQSDALTAEATGSDLAQGFRTNVLNDFTFTSRGELGFDITSFRVVNVDNGIGVLSRFDTAGSLHSADPRASMVNKSLAFNLHFDAAVAQPSDTGLFQPITDGVVHFRITAFDQYGRELMATAAWPDPLGLNLERLSSKGQALFLPFPDRPVDGTLVQEEDGQNHAWFYGALPTYFDVEMAVMGRTYWRRSAVATAVSGEFSGAKNRQDALFRQRVPSGKRLKVLGHNAALRWSYPHHAGDGDRDGGGVLSISRRERASVAVITDQAGAQLMAETATAQALSGWLVAW